MSEKERSMDHEYLTIPADQVQVGDEVFGEGEVLEVLKTVLLKCKDEHGFTSWYQTSGPLSVRRK